MKPLFVIAIIVFAFSCSKDNSEIKAEQINPLGSWSLFKLKLKSSTMGPLVRDTILVPCFKDVKLVFYDGGTIIGRYVGTEYCMSKITESLHVGWSNTIPDQYGTWAKSNDTLTVVMNNQPSLQMKYKLGFSGKSQIMGSSNPDDQYLTETWYIKDDTK